MRVHGRLLLFALGLLIVFASRIESASALSDRMLVTDITTGAVLADSSIAEGNPERLSFGVVPPVFLIDTVVVLTEPPGEPPEGTPVFVPETSQIVSDLIFLSTQDNQGHAIDPFVLFLSDGDSELAAFAAILDAFPFATLEETGELQDLTEFLGTAALGFRVQVQSDVVPEPATLALAGSVMVGFAAMARRGRPQRA